jgi:hypothetical protein
MGLKTTYYLRTLGASSIEKATTTLKTADRAPENIVKTAAPAANTESVASVYSQPIPFPSSQTVNQAVPSQVATYSEVEHALNIIKEKTREQAHTTSVGSGAGSATIKVNGKDVKICKILDPDCEACQ